MTYPSKHTVYEMTYLHKYRAYSNISFAPKGTLVNLLIDVVLYDTNYIISKISLKSNAIIVL